jgi:hypothetical protein
MILRLFSLGLSLVSRFRRDPERAATAQFARELVELARSA